MFKSVPLSLVLLLLVVLPSFTLINGVSATLSYSEAPEYRSIEGTGNNKKNVNWGRGNPPLSLERYPGPSTRNYSGRWGNPSLPGARLVSNALEGVKNSTTVLLNPRGLTDMHTVWGQFMAHDFILTTDDGESSPIPVPMCDTTFDMDCTGSKVMGFRRSMFDPDTTDPLNHITAYMDASQVYGSNTADVANKLREFKGGRMLINERGEVPLNTNNVPLANPVNRDATTLRMCGDVRCNVTPQMSAMHSLMLREHNRYCKEISAAHPTWNDEKIYQEARRRVGAHIQHITYREYIPALLGEPLPLYNGYDPTMNVGVDTAFGAAGFRYGHSEITSMVRRITAEGQEIPEGHLPLELAYFNPQNGLSAGIAPILQGMLTNRQQSVDGYFDDSVRNRLFGNRERRQRPVDLFALDIQRGRDQGVASYNVFRAAYGLPRANTFQEITNDTATAAALASAYASVDDVDLMVGMVLETPVKGSLGPLNAAMIKEQFVRMRDGDRFWYENNQFTEEELNDIKQTPLLKLIMRNVPEVVHPISNAFFVAPPSGAQMEDVARSLRIEFDESYVLSSYQQVFWTVEETQIRFGVLAKTSGWVGFGLSTHGGHPNLDQSAMSEVDITIGYQPNGASGPWVVEDFYSYDLGIPSRDVDLGCDNNIASYEVSQPSPGVMLMRFTKVINTVDSQAARGKLKTQGADVVKESRTALCDAPITFGEPMRVIYALHPVSSKLAYHGPLRGYTTLTFQPKSKSSSSGDSFPLWAIALIIGGVILLLTPIVWKMTADNREKNRLLDNERMATELAESVAEMDFDGVDVLFTLENPNRIQQAFKTIITQLKYFKSFMPTTLFVKDDEDDTPSRRQSRRQSALSGSGLTPQSPSASNQQNVVGVTEIPNTSRKDVCVMLINLRGTHGMLRDTPNILAEKHRSFLEAVLKAVDERKGVPDTFQGDRIMVSWNAVRGCGQRYVLSVRCGISLRSDVVKATGMSISVGVSSGNALCGNMGTATMKRYTILGPCVNQCALLQSKNSTIGTQVLCSNDVYVGCQQHVYSRLVDNLDTTAEFVWEPMVAIGSDDDEWMYQLDNAHASNPFAAHNHAVRLILTTSPSMKPENSSTEDDITKYVSTISDSETDVVLRYVVKLSQQRFQQSTSQPTNNIDVVEDQPNSTVDTFAKL